MLPASDAAPGAPSCPVDVDQIYHGEEGSALEVLAPGGGGSEDPPSLDRTEETDTAAACTPWKKYATYAVAVDPNQDDKATVIRVKLFARPHMRAFHCSWWAYFMCVFLWSTISPLLPEIQESLQLSREEMWTSNIFAVTLAILMCLLLGPFCDCRGARTPFALVLCWSSIPVLCTGFVTTATGFYLLRLFIGMSGGGLVMCQYWTISMFTKEIGGVSNALVAGWGSIGGPVAYLIVGFILFPLYKLFFDGNADAAWRTVSLLPAIAAFATGVTVFLISDDSPNGNIREMKEHAAMPQQVSAQQSLCSGLLHPNTWVLFLQYGCCFGVELTMNSAVVYFFEDKFDQSVKSTASVLAVLGLMNFFARGLGGWFSDWTNIRWGMRGRLLAQTIFLLMEGVCLFIFVSASTMTGAVVTMGFLMLFTQAAEGSTYGMVSYVDPLSPGSIVGIVGAGGFTGAACFGLCFLLLDYEKAFAVMGFAAVASALLSGFLCGANVPFVLEHTDKDSETQDEPAAMPIDNDGEFDTYAWQ